MGCPSHLKTARSYAAVPGDGLWLCQAVARCISVEVSRMITQRVSKPPFFSRGLPSVCLGRGLAMKYHPKGLEADVFSEVSIDPKGLQTQRVSKGFELCPDPNRNEGTRRSRLKSQRRHHQGEVAMAKAGTLMRGTTQCQVLYCSSVVYNAVTS